MDSPKLLIIDDNPDSLVALREIVVYAMPDCQVITACGPREGLMAAVTSRPDGALIDVQMPEMTGIEVCRQLKKDPLTQNVPIMLITSHESTSSLRAEALDAGADGFLSRPIDNVELLARIRVMFRIKKAEDEHRNLTTHLEALVDEKTRYLQESYGLLRALSEGIDDVLFIKDREGRYVMVNRAGARITGHSPDEVVGQTVGSIWPADMAEEILERDRRVMAEGRPLTWEVVLPTISGPRTFLITVAPHRNAQHEIVGVLGIGRDITDIRRGEQERGRLAEQLRQSQKVEAVGQLAAGIAHDFNNVLTAILGHADLAAQSLAPEHPAHTDLHMIEEAVRQATGVTKALLTFSRKVTTEKKPVNMRDVFEGAGRLFRGMLPASIELTQEVPHEPPLWVHGDQTQLQQVVLNLVLNARDAMPNGGTLRIGLSEASPSALGDFLPEGQPPAGVVCLTVSDTGVGISDEIRSRIFDPFFTTKDRGQGTGLGLSIVLGIVREHRGRVLVHSEPGRGSTFEVLLPRIQQDAAVSQKAVAVCPPQGAGDLILLAEDNPYVRQTLAKILRSLGYQIVEAADGESLLDAYRGHQAEARLIITDVDIPRINGTECLRRLRAQQCQLPTIVITGDAEFELEVDLSDRTVLLRKPFQISELAGLVAGALFPVSPTASP